MAEKFVILLITIKEYNGKTKKEVATDYWVRDLLGIANISPIVTGQERGTNKARKHDTYIQVNHTLIMFLMFYYLSFMFLMYLLIFCLLVMFVLYVLLSLYLVFNYFVLCVILICIKVLINL